jgi:hypothetical protein
MFKRVVQLVLLRTGGGFLGVRCVAAPSTARPSLLVRRCSGVRLRILAPPFQVIAKLVEAVFHFSDSVSQLRLGQDLAEHHPDRQDP